MLSSISLHKIVIILNLILISLLIIALFKNPYSYYIFLRIMCLSVMGMNLYYFWKVEKYFFIFGSLFFAILYNPISSFHLGRSNWEIVNIITIAYLTLSVYIIKKLK